MPTYLLIPLHTAEPEWRFAARRDPVQIIAASEQEARAGASAQFGMRSGGTLLAPADDPWMQSKWVYAHVIDAPDPALPLVRASEPAQADLAAQG